MSASEYRDWMNYYREEPWGSAIEDHRFATLASIMINVNGGYRNNKQASPDDFFIRSRAAEMRRKQQDRNTIVAQMKAAFTAHNDTSKAR